MNHPKRQLKRSRQKSHNYYEDSCKVCNGRGYVLVASKNIDSSSKIYERVPCQACAVEGFSEGGNSDELENSSRTLAGTGYLRNKKRRRKGSQ